MRLRGTDDWNDDMRIAWLTLGLASLALGGLGVALPLLPTTPFVLLAAYCFARSSRKLHDWLLDSRTFGKAIRDWRAHRAISRRSKAMSVFAMALSLAASFVLAVDLVIIGLQSLVLSGAAAFVLTRDTAP
jgi:uncharacterized membrane protein YbaN (DUF454 family)